MKFQLFQFIRRITGGATYKIAGIYQERGDQYYKAMRIDNGQWIDIHQDRENQYEVVDAPTDWLAKYQLGQVLIKQPVRNAVCVIIGCEPTFPSYKYTIIKFNLQGAMIGKSEWNQEDIEREYVEKDLPFILKHGDPVELVIKYMQAQIEQLEESLEVARTIYGNLHHFKQAKEANDGVH